MSIQRWKVVDTLGQYAETGDDGAWVTYADHVAAVAEARQAGRLLASKHESDVAAAERARIKAAVQALYSRMWDESQDFPASDDVLAIIDGEDTA